jgi:hypothetical protein
VADTVRGALNVVNRAGLEIAGNPVGIVLGVLRNRGRDVVAGNAVAGALVCRQPATSYGRRCPHPGRQDHSRSIGFSVELVVGLPFLGVEIPALIFRTSAFAGHADPADPIGVVKAAIEDS